MLSIGEKVFEGSPGISAAGREELSAAEDGSNIVTLLKQSDEYSKRGTHYLLPVALKSSTRQLFLISSTSS